MALSQQVLDALTNLVGRWNTRVNELSNWFAGTATGGPGNDGMYPFTDAAGTQTLNPSIAKIISDSGLAGDSHELLIVGHFSDIANATVPVTKSTIMTLGYYAPADSGNALYVRVNASAATPYSHLYRIQSADGQWWEYSGDTAWVEQFGAVGYHARKSVPNSNIHDSLINFQAAIEWNRSRTQGMIGSRSYGRYMFSDTLVIDPSREGFEGNSCVLDWRLKTFYDPAAQPELITNPSFNSGVTGWTVTTNTTVAPVFTDGRLDFYPPNDPESTEYLEIGQMVTCAVGDTLMIEVEFEEIRTRQVSFNTFRSVLFTLRRNNGTSANNNIGIGPLQTTLGTATNLQSQYAAGKIFRYTASVATANPYLRIQTNADVSIKSVSVKVKPKNTCILLRTSSVAEGGQLRGHNYKDMRNFKITGKAGVERDWGVGMELDTPHDGLSSRVNIYNMDISDNLGIGLLFGNRAYLMNFYSCRIVTRDINIDSYTQTDDAGENIVFYGGNSGGGRIGVRNEGAMALYFFGHSIDFAGESWLVGGLIHFEAGWLEINVNSIDPGEYLIKATKGTISLSKTRITFGGSATEEPVGEAAYYVAKGAILKMDVLYPYNSRGYSKAMCAGEGRFEHNSLGGENKAISSIAMRNVDHNILGRAGYFEGTKPGFLMWTESTDARSQISRELVGFHTVANTTSTFYRGQRLITVASTAGMSIGCVVTGDGIQPDTIVLVIDPIAKTLVLSKAVVKSVTDSTVRIGSPNPSGIAGFELSNVDHRTTDNAGVQGLHIFKQGIGGIGSLKLQFACPIDAFRTVGAEWFYKIPAGGSGTADVYFTSYFANIYDNGDKTPYIAQQQFISDLPQTDLDLVAGTDWIRVSSSTGRIDDSTIHDGYSPFWATHFLVTLNMASAPNGFQMFMDDYHVNMI